LLQVDRQKDQFLGILSHELRTPLNAILGFASVLADEVSGPLSPLQHQHMGKILGGTEVLLALINDLLDMSRIQAGKFTLSVGPMDFGRVAATALENLAGLAENRQLTLVNEVPAGLPSLVADEQRVSQILLNLLGNAIKFTPAGGVVTLRAASNGGQLRVEVADTGPGIPPEDLPRLFHPFTQLDMSATRPASGTGLGLSIVKALAEAHGGQVGVTSVLGHGATFWFTLPTG
jgi:signal transduction histidine kinase